VLVALVLAIEKALAVVVVPLFLVLFHPQAAEAAAHSL
jgi:hypothetical protein